MASRAPTAVAFDAFGTLCDFVTRGSAVRRMARGAGVSLSALWHRALTENMDFEALLSPAVPARAAILDAIRLDVAGELASFYLYSDTARSLTALRDLGVPTALVSNVAHPYVALLRHAFEPLVDHFVLSCEVGVAKPSPHIFGLACRLLRREAHCVLMVGDSLRSDIEPATRLGMLAARINRRPRDGSRPSHELSAILSAHWALPQEESSE